jgi:hypothetical protein
MASARKDLIQWMEAYLIPENMRPELLRWIEDGIRPGDFLNAIIENDLYRTFNIADDENIFRIQSYVKFFYNCTPIGCWGSIIKAKEWEKHHNRPIKISVKDLFDESHDEAGE